MKRLLVAAALLASTVAANAGNEFVAEEAVYQALWFTDMGTTLDIRHHPEQHETNQMLGEHPSNGRVYRYFLVGSAVHAAVTYELVQHNAPKIVIRGWELVTIGIEAQALETNFYLGLHCKFK